MSEKIEQSMNMLQLQLRDQLKLLENSTIAFDNGDDIEAMNMAVRIRVLLHDTKRQKSLLSQLGIKEKLFLSTCHKYDPNNPLAYKGLLSIYLGDKEVGLFAPLDDSEAKRNIPFEEWWNEIVFVDQEKNELSRKDIILSLADQDGGAHVDPTLDSTYAKLSRYNSLGLFRGNDTGWESLQHPERVTTRQIAHEVLKTLKSEYTKKQNLFGDGYIIGDIQISVDDSPKYKKVGRNAPCPCGSEKKYKKCHGR